MTRPLEILYPLILCTRRGPVSIPLRLSGKLRSRPGLDTHSRLVTWSVLGPHGFGNRWSLAGTSGHGRYVTIAGHRAYRPRASGGGTGRGRVRTPRSSRPDPEGQLSAGAQVATIAPVIITLLSSSRSGLSAPSSRKMRLPPPTTSGSIITRNSSTRLCSSVWTKRPTLLTHLGPPSRRRQTSARSARSQVLFGSYVTVGSASPPRS